MLKKQLFFLIGLCFGATLPLCATGDSADMVVQLGGKTGWKNLSRTTNIVSTTGAFGYEAKALEKNAVRKTDYLDLLLNFDEPSIRDESGKYRLVNASDVANYKKSNDAKTGTGALLSTARKPLILSGLHNASGQSEALFATGGYKGSFSISFWIKPFLVQSHENVFSWNSSRNVLGEIDKIIYQSIDAVFFKGKVRWQFSNIFASKNVFESDFVLEGTTMLIPNAWSHHSFVYNEGDQTIEYYVNGVLEAVQSVKHLYPYLGIQADIKLCQNYTGLLDAFMIAGDAVAPKTSSGSYTCCVYTDQRGRFETQPLDLETYGAQLKKLEAIVDIPEQTDIAFFVRSGDNFYEWTDSYPQWYPISLGEAIRGVNGRFAQVAVELYSDGAGKQTPSITELNVFYQQTEAPLAPYALRAEGGNGFVDISWAKTLDKNTAGYLVYYGEKPGEYLGRFAIEGYSPIKIPGGSKIRINGLQNGKIYYFAIRAYSGIDERIIGPFSNEVWARPQEK